MFRFTLSFKDLDLVSDLPSVLESMQPRQTVRLPSALLAVGEPRSPCQAGRAGQPVAAGDQQISDVAMMPLMKLTQHSLPPRGPLRGSCSAPQTPSTHMHTSTAASHCSV